MKVYGIIPARLQSTRLPRKLLLAETGRSILEYTWMSASQAASLSELIIAVDSEEVATVVNNFGGRCEMTGEHPSGTDRVAEVAARCCPDGDIFVNIQGDEPEIDPKNIDAVVRALVDCPSAQMATIGNADANDRPSSGNVLRKSRSRRGRTGSVFQPMSRSHFAVIATQKRSWKVSIPGLCTSEFMRIAVIFCSN